jgi:hypothetical protein
MIQQQPVWFTGDVTAALKSGGVIPIAQAS